MNLRSLIEEGVAALDMSGVRSMRVFCLDDAGALVEATGTKVQIMRDEMDVPIFIIEREV